MDPKETALILIGYQNDFFASDGALSGVFENPENLSKLLQNTSHLIEKLSPAPVLIISTPIIFTRDYSELVDPTGILKSIKDAGAFMAGDKGAETVPELLAFGERIMTAPGKRGLNAFSNTELDKILKDHGIKNVVLLGVVVSICIDSTGRSAYEKGYKVFVLSDCTLGRTSFEQEFFCSKILPLYSETLRHDELLAKLGVK